MVSVGTRASVFVGAFIHRAVRSVIVEIPNCLLESMVRIIEIAEHRLLRTLTRIHAWVVAQRLRLVTTGGAVCLDTYVIGYSFTMPLPPDGSLPRPLAVAFGFFLAGAITHGAVQMATTPAERNKLVEWSSVTLFRTGQALERRRWWRHFVMIIESRRVPVCLFVLNMVLTFVWPSPYVEQLSSHVPRRSAAWYLTILMAYPFLTAMVITALVFFSAAVRQAVLDELPRRWRRTARQSGLLHALPRGVYFTLAGALVCSLIGFAVESTNSSLASNVFNIATLIVLMTWGIWVSIVAYRAERLYGPLILLLIAGGVWGYENAVMSSGPVTFESWAVFAINVTVAACLLLVRTVALLRGADKWPARIRWHGMDAEHQVSPSDFGMVAR